MPLDSRSAGSPNLYTKPDGFLACYVKMRSQDVFELHWLYLYLSYKKTLYVFSYVLAIKYIHKSFQII